MDVVTVVKFKDTKSEQSRRPGIMNRPLVGEVAIPSDFSWLKLVIIEFTKGVVAEVHPARNLEVIHVLSGVYDLVLRDKVIRLEAGDTVAFPIGSLHGVKCIEGGRWLNVFCNRTSY